MNLKHLSDESLILAAQEAVALERRVSLSVLYHLREIERRALYAQSGCASLYEYVTRILGYAEASAQRRIQAARLLSDCPELAPQIETGSFSLSVLSQAQTFFRKEEIKGGAEKREILKSLEHQSVRQAERKLLALAKNPAQHIPEKIRAISSSLSEVRFMAEAQLLGQIEELKDLLGQSSLAQVIAYAVQAGLEKKRPKAPKGDLPKVRRESAPTSLSPQGSLSPPTSVAHTRYVRQEVRRVVWARDRGQCSYQDPKTGCRCQSRFGLELDHLKPFAQGGENSAENLALKCRAHNTWAAIGSYGLAKMSLHVRSLK